MLDAGSKILIVIVIVIVILISPFLIPDSPTGATAG